jgi:hypothetical protein
MSELSESCIKLLGTATIADFHIDTVYDLYTVPQGKTLVLDTVFIKGAGALVQARFTIGQSTALTDFSIGVTASTGIVIPTNVAASGDVIAIRPSFISAATPTKQKTYAAGTVIQLDITTINTASVAGTAYIFGFLF